MAHLTTGRLIGPAIAEALNLNGPVRRIVLDVDVNGGLVLVYVQRYLFSDEAKNLVEVLKVASAVQVVEVPADVALTVNEKGEVEVKG